MKIDLAATDPKLLEDPEVRELLSEYDQSLEANPLQNYFPYDKQRAFHMAKVRLRILLGGNRAGKSTTGGVNSLIQAMDEDSVPDHLKDFKIWQPPFYCRIITPDFTRTLKAVAEVIRRWCPRHEMRGGSWEKAWSQQEKVFYFANESFFEFLTYEQDLDKHGGTARHRVWFDEEPDGEKGEAVREEASMRLIDFKGDEIFTFTPLNGLGWTFDEFWEEKGPEIEKDVWVNETMAVVRADMSDNLSLDKDEIEYRLSKLPERQRNARKSGNFEHFKGLVYEMFDPEIHVVPMPNRQHVQSLQLSVAIDPGMQCTAVQFAGFDRDNAMLTFDELHLSDEDAIPENAAAAIINKLKWWGIFDTSKVRFWIDPSARNRSLTDAQRVQQLYKNAGIRASGAQNDVEMGVFEMQRRLENKDAAGNPAPLYFVAENCTHTRKEFPRYRLDIQEDGKFKVVKRGDHHMDGDRYNAASRPLPQKPRPKPRHRQEVYVPGTVPAVQPRQRAECGPFGRYA